MTYIRVYNINYLPLGAAIFLITDLYMSIDTFFVYIYSL